jgi:hypothetical protein
LRKGITFQALDNKNILVLGLDGNLWLEHAPFGTPPPAREQVDKNVHNFEALDDKTVLVLGIDGNLWLEHAPFGTPPPAREQVDKNVRNFEALEGERCVKKPECNAP